MNSAFRHLVAQFERSIGQALEAAFNEGVLYGEYFPEYSI